MLSLGMVVKSTKLRSIFVSLWPFSKIRVLLVAVSAKPLISMDWLAPNPPPRRSLILIPGSLAINSGIDFDGLDCIYSLSIM